MFAWFYHAAKVISKLSVPPISHCFQLTTVLPHMSQPRETTKPDYVRAMSKINHPGQAQM